MTPEAPTRALLSQTLLTEMVLERSPCIHLCIKNLWRVSLMGLLFGSGWAFAHPYHTSLAEITWKNAPLSYSSEFKGTASTSPIPTLSGTLQVSLKVIPEDLEAILGAHQRHPVVLDDSPETDKAIVAYLWQKFRVREESGKQMPMQWLGKQVQHNNTWLFFELAIDQARSLSLENRVLMDFKESQTNRVSVEINGIKMFQTFTTNDNTKMIWGEI